MEFRILGPLEVLDEGHELPLGPAKERAVLGVLLLHAGSVVSRTQLIDGLWGGSPPPTAAKAVNVYVSQARRTLSRNGGEPIVTRPLGYVLDLNVLVVGIDLQAARGLFHRFVNPNASGLLRPFVSNQALLLELHGAGVLGRDPSLIWSATGGDLVDLGSIDRQLD